MRFGQAKGICYLTLIIIIINSRKDTQYAKHLKSIKQSTNHGTLSPKVRIIRCYWNQCLLWIQL